MRSGRSAAGRARPRRGRAASWRALIACQLSSSQSTLRRHRRQPAPAEVLLRGDLVGGEGARRPPQHRRRRGASLGDQRGEAVEQQVGRTRRVRRRGGGPARPARPRAGCRRWPAARRTAPRPTRRGRSRARARGSSGSRRLAALQQQRRRVAPDARRRTRSVRAAAPRGRAGARRAARPRPWPAARAPRRTRPPAGWPARRPARGPPVAPGRRVSATERCRNAAAAASPPRACARPADRSSSERDLLVGSRRRCGEMPGAAVGVDLRIGRLRQRQVHRPALLRRRRPVDRRAHQRMAERHPLADRQQPLGLGGGRRRGVDAEPLGRAPHQQRVADRLGRRDQQPAAGSRRAAPSSRRRKLSSIRPDSAVRAQQPEPARQLRRGQPSRQLQQRQRIARASRPRSGRGPARRAEAGRPSSSSARASPSRSPRPRAPAARRSSVARLACGEHQRRPTPRAAAARRTRAPAPRRWSSHCASSTTHSSGRSSATSDSRLSTASPTRKRSGGGPAAQPERDRQRVALRRREPLQPVEHRRAQLVQRGERQLHLGLDARRPHDPAARGAPRPRSPAAPSCRRRPRRARPACGSHPRGPPRAARRAPRTRCAARATWPTPAERDDGGPIQRPADARPAAGLRRCRRSRR